MLFPCGLVQVDHRYDELFPLGICGKFPKFSEHGSDVFGSPEMPPPDISCPLQTSVMPCERPILSYEAHSELIVVDPVTLSLIHI